MASRPKIIVTNRVFPETLALLSARGDVDCNESGKPWTREEALRHCAGADAVLAFMTDCLDASFIQACPNLKIIGGAFKGVDNIDASAAERCGVWVTIVPDLLTVPTAELAIGLMLAVGRHIVAGDRKIRTHGFSGWRPHFYGQGISGSTVFIVGFGNIGKAIARLLAAFDCCILACDTRIIAGERPYNEVSMVPFHQGLGEADFVVLAIPLSPETGHIISHGNLRNMKRGAYLINVARGSLVDEAAVAEAIDEGHLAGYASDVFECEDWARSDRPAAIQPRLRAIDQKTVLTPHIGSAVRSFRRDIELHAARNIIAVLNGEHPPSAVNDPRQHHKPARA